MRYRSMAMDGHGNKYGYSEGSWVFESRTQVYSFSYRIVSFWLLCLALPTSFDISTSGQRWGREGKVYLCWNMNIMAASL